MAQPMVLAILGGGVAALLLLTGLSGGMFAALLAYFTPLPILWVGLGLGAGAVPIAAASGIVLIMLLGPAAAAAVFVGMHALPSWMVVRQALGRRQAAGPGGPETWVPAGDVLASLSVFAAVAVAGFGLFALGGAMGIEATLQEALDDWVKQGFPTLSEVDRREVTGSITPMFLGLGGAVWIAAMALNTGLAQTLLVKRGRNLRPTPRWSDLTLPDWLSWVLVAAAALALVAGGDLGYLARNIAVVLAVPFFFVGLAVVHRLTGRLSFGGGMLAAFYVLLLIMLPGVGTVVALLGIIEQWIGIRRRLPGGPSDRETS